MNKAKKSDPKKILVRNTELPLPKTRLIIEGKPEANVKKKTEPKTGKSRSEQKPESKFQSPELQSTLKFARKINDVEKTKSEKFKKSSDVAFCEKVTRKINFPSDQAIYKDLIPLCVPAKSTPVLSSRDPLPQKDKEPVLSDYVEVSHIQEYVYKPTIKLEKEAIKPQIDNLRLYKIIQMHNQ